MRRSTGEEPESGNILRTTVLIHPVDDSDTILECP